MMRSLFSGVSGLRTHQTKMDVIGNNISNVNTIGFKKAAVTFSDVFSQTTEGATAANEASGRGGKNAMQIGLGSSVSAITNIMTDGSPQRTDNGNDLMISGDSFLILQDNSGFYFTRAGALEVDKNGNLIDSNGIKVCGWQAVDDEENPGQQKIVQGKVTPLNLYDGEKSYIEPSVTTRIDFNGNINKDKANIQRNTMYFYDSVGNMYTVDTSLAFNPETNKWDFTMNNTATINNDNSNQVTLTGLDQTISIEFKDGLPVGDSTALQLVLTGVTVEGNNPYNSEFNDTITIDFSRLTQFASTVDATATTLDGNAAGSLTSYSFGKDGKITGKYTNGLSKILGQIVVADFVNPAGLQKEGSNLYTSTVNSGDFDGIGLEIGATGGEFIPGSLEMSNVDLAYEFTEMITTQRGFQANSRVITTSDDMLQELVNLKR